MGVILETGSTYSKHFSFMKLTVDIYSIWFSGPLNIRPVPALGLLVHTTLYTSNKPFGIRDHATQGLIPFYFDHTMSLLQAPSCQIINFLHKISKTKHWIPVKYTKGISGPLRSKSQLFQRTPQCLLFTKIHNLPGSMP